VLLTFGSLLFAGIFIREVIVHWQLSSNFHPDLIECTESLRKTLKDIHNLQNTSKDMIEQIRKREPVVSPIIHSDLPPENLVVEKLPKAISTTENEHVLSMTEIFRRFVLQPPAPAKVPYNLKNMEATLFHKVNRTKRLTPYSSSEKRASSSRFPHPYPRQSSCAYRVITRAKASRRVENREELESAY
jgi:hypothetical protein